MKAIEISTRYREKEKRNKCAIKTGCLEIGDPIFNSFFTSTSEQVPVVHHALSLSLSLGTLSLKLQADRTEQGEREMEERMEKSATPNAWSHQGRCGKEGGDGAAVARSTEGNASRI